MQSSVHLRIDQNQVRLFDGEIGLQVGNVGTEVLRSLLETRGVEAERSGGAVRQVVQDGTEILRKAGGGRLQKILDVGVMAGEVRAERAIVV